MEKLKDFLASNISNPMRKNHVLVVVKPGFDKLVGEICDIFKKNNYSIVKSKCTIPHIELDKDKIREEYGESDMRNVLHSSDSYKSFVHEAGIYFYVPGLDD